MCALTADQQNKSRSELFKYLNFIVDKHLNNLKVSFYLSFGFFFVSFLVSKRLRVHFRFLITESIVWITLLRRTERVANHHDRQNVLEKHEK